MQIEIKNDSNQLYYRMEGTFWEPLDISMWKFYKDCYEAGRIHTVNLRVTSQDPLNLDPGETWLEYEPVNGGYRSSGGVFICDTGFDKLFGKQHKPFSLVRRMANKINKRPVVWVVYNATSKQTWKGVSEKTAKSRAEKFAQENPGDEIYVLRAMHKYVANGIQHEEF